MTTLAEHIAVFGPSGGGKSTYLRMQHASFDGSSIFLTSKSGERKSHHNPPKRVRRSSAAYPDDINRARSWAIRRSGPVQVIVDECQNAPSFVDGEGPLRTGLHEDREQQIRFVIATQNPQDLHTRTAKYGPVQQCRYWVFVGPAKDWHTGFLKGNNLADLIPHLPKQNFEYVVIDPTAALSAAEKVVYRGTTDRRYG